MNELLASLPAWLEDLLILSAAALAGLAGYGLLLAALRLATPAAARFVVDPLLQRCRAPASALAPLVGLHLALPLTALEPSSNGCVRFRASS